MPRALTIEPHQWRSERPLLGSPGQPEHNETGPAFPRCALDTWRSSINLPCQRGCPAHACAPLPAEMHIAFQRPLISCLLASSARQGTVKPLGRTWRRYSVAAPQPGFATAGEACSASWVRSNRCAGTKPGERAMPNIGTENVGPCQAEQLEQVLPHTAPAAARGLREQRTQHDWL